MLLNRLWQKLLLRLEWDKELAEVRNRYSCDYCGSNCGQCGWSDVGRDQAVQKVNKKFKCKMQSVK